MADLHEIELADGTRFKTALPPSRLAELGLPQSAPGPSLGERGATAFNWTPTNSQGVPQSATDAIPGLGAALGGGGGGRVQIDPLKAPPSLPVESQESVSASDKEAAQTIDKSREGRERTPGLRGGGEVKDLDLGSEQYAQPSPVAQPRSVTIRAKDTKGADIRTGFSVQKSGATDMLPEHEEQASDARINAKLAGQELADNKADTLERDRGFAVEEQIRREEQAAALQAKQVEIRRRKEEASANLLALDTEHDEIQKLKVNPNQFWDGLGTGGKILAAIGMIAGGINSGLKGGPNQAAEFIYRSIRDDINGQREKIEARRQGYNVKETRLEKRAAQLGGDLELAAKELEANQLALASAIGKKHAAESGLANVNPELMLTFAKMDEEAANMRLDNAAKYSAKVAESFQFIPDKTVTVGGAAPVKPEVRERMVRFGDGGQVGYVVAGNARDKVQSAISGFQNISGGIRELKSLAAQASTGNLEAQRRYNSLRSALLTEANVLRGQGAMSEGDQGNMEAGMPDVAKLTTTRGEAAARLDEQERWSNQRLRATVRDNIYADPDATTPVLRGDAGGLRRE